MGTKLEMISKFNILQLNLSFCWTFEDTSRIPNVSSYCTGCIYISILKARPVQRKQNVKKVSFWFVFFYVKEKRT